METDFLHLKRQLTWLKGYAAVSSLLFLLLGLLALTPPSRDIIRAKGIVIEDDQGHDRILIGSPIPASRDRVRTDPARVRQAWAAKLGGDKYMQYYATYDNEASGIVFLNDKGFDKLVLGDKTPDANIGKRQVKLAGLTFNDDEGFERGGLGVGLTATGQYRAMVGLDDANGREAVHLMALEDGTKGILIGYPEGKLFLGSAKANNGLINSPTDVSGLLAIDKQGKLLPTPKLVQK